MNTAPSIPAKVTTTDVYSDLLQAVSDGSEGGLAVVLADDALSGALWDVASAVAQRLYVAQVAAEVLARKASA